MYAARMVFWRRKQGVVAEPGEVVALDGVDRVRVWDVFIDVGRRGALTVGDERFTIADLPRRWERYELREGPSPRTLVVDVVRPADAEFHGAIEGFCSASCTPVVPFDWEGIALDGPRRVRCAESIAADWSDDGWVAHPVPRFVVAGTWRFSGTTLGRLDRDPHDAIEVVVEHTGHGEITRQSVQGMWDAYEYHVLGVSVSPAEPPPRGRRATPDPNMSIGGYFNAPMGLLVGEPQAPYTLRVHAAGAGFVSNVVEIEIQP